MNPYRVPAPQPIEVKHKPRGWLKTFKLKALIWFKGTWKERFWRCEYCKKYVLDRRRGPELDPRPFFHMMRCYKVSPADQERYEKSYWFASAPEPDDDMFGPLR